MPYDPEKHGSHRIVGPGFHERVFTIVSQVPSGAVTTYGEVARALGSVKVARQVGYALAAIPEGRRDVPWYRVVNALGRVHRPADDPGGREQRRRLRREGIEVDESGRIRRFAEVRFQFEQSFTDESGE